MEFPGVVGNNLGKPIHNSFLEEQPVDVTTSEMGKTEPGQPWELQQIGEPTSLETFQPPPSTVMTLISNSLYLLDSLTSSNLVQPLR